MATSVEGSGLKLLKFPLACTKALALSGRSDLNVTICDGLHVCFQVAVCNLASIALNMFVKTEDRDLSSNRKNRWFDFEMLKKVTKVCK